jgi:hypothetical protein
MVYRLAYLAGDQAGMDRQIAGAAGKPDEYTTLEWQAAVAAQLGQWKRSGQYVRTAIQAATENDAREVGALYAAEAALRSAVTGKPLEARALADQSLSIEQTPASLPRALLALSLCGETARARSGLDELIRRYPKYTLINGIWLPVIRASLEMNRNQDAPAIELLKPAARYEAAAEFWPQYLRGQAYLRMRRGPESAAEFQRIVDHRGQAVESKLYPLAKLGLARALAMEAETAKAREQYQELIAMWQHADNDLTPLDAARQELAKLR